jgi:LDH2 family malate/lactate/ureidoglycolate dehydrogenase
VSRDGAVIRVCGNRGFGQFAAREMTMIAIEAAHEAGVAVATLSGVKHIGRLGEFAALAAARDCVALITCNSGPPGGLVAPFGGRQRALGTNPLAYAIPAGAGPPIVADFSTSAAAEGKVRLYRHAGRRLPEGWLMDRDGNPTTDPADLYDGGAILPAAAHKGSALSLMVEILGGVLAGEGCASTGGDPGNGVVMIAIDVRRFCPAESFGAAVDRVIEALESVPPAPGFHRVMAPGAPEIEVRRSRDSSGIPFVEETWLSIVEAANSVGVEVEERSDIAEK